MRGTCSPVSDTPGLVGGCRHDHALCSDAGVRYSAVSDAILGVEVGAVLVLSDTCFDNAVRSLLHCNSACEVDLGDSLLDHAVVVLDVDPCLREKRSVDLSCFLIDEPVHHSELRLRIQQVLTALELYILFCHIVFLFLHWLVDTFSALCMERIRTTNKCTPSKCAVAGVGRVSEDAHDSLIYGIAHVS